MYGDSLNDTILFAFLTDMQDKKTDQFMKIILIIANIGFLTCSTTSIPLVYFTLKQNFFSTYKYIIKKSKKGKTVEMTNEDKKVDDNDINLNMNSHNAINDGYDTDNSAEESNSEANTAPKNINNDNGNDRMSSIASIESGVDDKPKKIRVNVPRRTEIIISVILYITVGIVTILVPKLKSMFNIVGCTAANAIQFIIPSLIIVYLGEKAEKLVSVFCAKLLLIFGIVSLIICLTAEILHFFTSDP
jgi:hypothetical protein